MIGWNWGYARIMKNIALAEELMTEWCLEVHSIIN